MYHQEGRWFIKWNIGSQIVSMTFFALSITLKEEWKLLLWVIGLDPEIFISFVPRVTQEVQ
jgi:hypothetical protein